MAYSERRINSNDTAETASIGASFKKSQPGVPVACRLLEHPLSVCSQLSSSNIDKLECLSVRDASVGGIYIFSFGNIQIFIRRVLFKINMHGGEGNF
eukprot:c24850_g1_i2 orf=304-594(+)